MTEVVFLDDIIQACEKIGRYTAGTTLEGFRRDEKTIDAVVRNLEIIGEAAKSLPEDLRTNIAADWKRLAGLRDVLIHAYFGIDVDIIWDIAQTKVPELRRSVTAYLNQHP